jgi:non-ribosomal peptide synthetase component E (peptide arylation enzyme)
MFIDGDVRENIVNGQVCVLQISSRTQVWNKIIIRQSVSYYFNDPSVSTLCCFLYNSTSFIVLSSTLLGIY